eukprot:3936262-Rhodomonas_salina.1
MSVPRLVPDTHTLSQYITVRSSPAPSLLAQYRYPCAISSPPRHPPQYRCPYAIPQCRAPYASSVPRAIREPSTAHLGAVG